MDKRRSVKEYLRLLRKLGGAEQEHTLEVFLSNGGKIRLKVRVDAKEDRIYLVKDKAKETA